METQKMWDRVKYDVTKHLQLYSNKKNVGLNKLIPIMTILCVKLKGKVQHEVSETQEYKKYTKN